MEYRWSMGFPARVCSGPASAVARKQSPRLLSEVSSLSMSWKRGSAPWGERKEQCWRGPGAVLLEDGKLPRALGRR